MALLKCYRLEWHRRPFSALAGALVGFDDEYYVVTNSRESWARQRFTAAHELKHYLTNRHLAPVFTCSRRLVTAIERAANVFARELLMPEETMRRLYARGFYVPEQIGRTLGVSNQAAGLRMAELELGREQAWWGDYL